MTGYNHTLAGCLLAVTTPAPLAPLLSLTSHYVMDAMPHFGRSPRFQPGQPAFKWLLAVDGCLCLLVLMVAWWLRPELWWLTGLCAFLAAAPDFMWLLGLKRFKLLAGYFWFAGVIQWGERPWAYPLEVFYGLILSIGLFGLSY